MWLLGIELRTFGEQAMLLTTEPSLQPFLFFFKGLALLLVVMFMSERGY